jgi:hypothetical protein
MAYPLPQAAPTLILPTDGLLQELHNYASNMQVLEFDMYELVRLAIDALTFAVNYPHSFESEVAMGFENRPVVALSMEDCHVLNDMMRQLYECLFRSFCALGLYDSSGVLHHRFFDFYHGDIIVSTQPITMQPAN